MKLFRKQLLANLTTLLICFLIISACKTTQKTVNDFSSGGDLEPGSGTFWYNLPQEGRKLRIWYHKPNNLDFTSQVVFVMHTGDRNAKAARNAWIQYAENDNFLLLVPEFTKKYFPGSDGYALGNVFNSSGIKNDEEIWSISAIEPIFDYVKKLNNLQTNEYSMFGLSHGAIFINTMVLFKPDARIKTAIVCNAGWYVMPSWRPIFPYGLRETGTPISNIASAFQKNLIILVGEEAVDKNDKGLRTSIRAMMQGEHRLERGNSFYNTAKKIAEEENVDLNWRIVVAPGAAYQGNDLSEHGAKLLN